MLKDLIAGALFTCAVAGSASAETFAEFFPDLAQEADAEILALLEPLDFQQGRVSAGDGLVTLNVADGFYFLNADDARYVLGDLWGNPPSPDVLGMVFPSHITPLHSNSWGMEIYFDEIGYVPDEEAEGYDYDAVLRVLQEDTLAENGWRVENGYPSIRLLGWAESPVYDPAHRSLYWAKELQFQGDTENTLNYNIRVLGRHGVLVQNFIAPMSALDEVRAAVPEILAMTEFSEGNRYGDFDASMDQVAAYGIGGLIAGKVIAKTGMLAFLLVFLKKAWVLLFLPLFWLKNRFTGSRTT